jgi:predicted PurR-regulated permease PerM
MAFFDSSHQRAAILLALLAIGLTFALAPYATGLIGVPVLYIILAPLHRQLRHVLPAGPAAAIAILMALLVFVVPGVALIGLLVNEAQNMAVQVTNGPLLDRIRVLQIGPYRIGDEIVRLGQQLVTFLGASALKLVGTATRLSINLLISFVGVYYLLIGGQQVWRGVRPYIPFSSANTEILRRRFEAITVSTVIGTGLTALLQGTVVALGFTFVGLGNPLFWGVVTIVFAILPVVGSGMIWVPAVAVLFASNRPGAGIFLALWCLATVMVIDYVVRPLVFNRFAKIHPMITLVGAIAGISYLGLLGLLVGPLALSYFFEIIRMYREEYLPDEGGRGLTEERLAALGGTVPAPAPGPAPGR